MAKPKATATDNLSVIPDNISVSFLPDLSKVSSKALEKSLSFYKECYVHDIKFFIDPDFATATAAAPATAATVNPDPVPSTSRSSHDPTHHHATDSDRVVQVSAKCWRSMKKNDTPHKLCIHIPTNKQTLSESYCSCKNG